MEKKTKIKRLLDALRKSDDGLGAFVGVESEIQNLIGNAKKQVTATSLQNVNVEIEKFRKQIDLTPLTEAIADLKEGAGSIQTELSSKLESQLGEVMVRIETSLEKIEKANTDTIQVLEELGTIKGENTTRDQTLSQLELSRGEFVTSMESSNVSLESLRKSVEERMDSLAGESESSLTLVAGGLYDELEDIRKIIEALRTRVNGMGQHVGGGSANRNIAIGGNTSVLSQFTDINLKAGSNVTITYQVNQVTKYTDITISATGGSGSGITREINTVAINTLAGSTAGIDYVYLASGNVTITLPTTVGNKNLYTIKNIGAGTVTVDTTGGETIDGGLTAVMPVQFTSIDLISNNSGNWDVT